MRGNCDERNSGRVKRRGGTVFSKYFSLLTDRNHIYTVCAAYVDMATCSTSSQDTEVLRTTVLTVRNRTYISYSACADDYELAG
jgi:hypothetical protein